MSALAFITIAGISLDLCKRKSLPTLERADVLFLLWMAYRWARMTGPLNFGTMSEDVLCIGIWTYFRMVSVRGSRKYLEWGICLSAAVQVIVVLLQWSGHMLSLHPDFDVTGSEKAIPMLERQTGYVNTSRLQMDLATAYEDAMNMDKALMHYRKAQVMRPGLIEPVYAQFSIYKASNRNKALSLARECVRIQPKVNNPKTEAMKAEARKYIARSARFPARKDK